MKVVTTSTQVQKILTRYLSTKIHVYLIENPFAAILSLLCCSLKYFEVRLDLHIALQCFCSFFSVEFILIIQVDATVLLDCDATDSQ